MSIERPVPANDNFSPGELRQQRRKALEHSSAIVENIRSWIKRKEEENTLAASDLGNISTARRDEIQGALSSLVIAVVETENALAAAEEQPDSLEAFEAAIAAGKRLSATIAEAEGIIDQR